MTTGGLVVIPGGGLFRQVEGEYATFECSGCGARVRLQGGEADAHTVQHEPGCALGAVIAEAGDMPVILRSRRRAN